MLYPANRPRSAALAAFRWMAAAALLLLPSQALATDSAWTVAPLFGGDVRSLAFDPQSADRVFAGTSGGHVYLSEDGGESWRDAGRSVPFPGWVVKSLTFDPNRPSRLWAGLWGVWGGGAVAVSDDGGRYWRSRHQGLPGQVYALTTVAGREGWLYAGTRQGVYRSTDGGESWSRATGRWPEIQKVTSLWVDPDAPDRLMAGTWRRAYLSEDGGLTWRGVHEGMVLDSEVFTLNDVPGRPDEMWASTCGWVYRSLDRGESWTRFTDGLMTRRVPAFRPLPDGQLLAGTVRGLYGSRTGGGLWQRRTSEELSILDIAYHPSRPHRVLVATEGSGVWVSTDGAETFRPARASMTNVRVTSLAAIEDPNAAGRVVLLAAVNHAGPGSGIYRSRGTGPDPVSGGFEHEAKVPTILSLAGNGKRVWAATERGLFERRKPSSKATATWFRRPELGERRVEEVTVAGTRVVARTANGLYELSLSDRFEPVAYRHGPPRSAALLGGALWVAEGDALHRLTEQDNHTLTSPFFGGRLVAVGDLLLLAGDGGLWSRKGLAGDWVELGSEPARALATGDSRHPLLVLRGEEALLLALREEDGSARYRPVDLDVPAREVAAALVVEGPENDSRLWVGTVSQGLRSIPLAHPENERNAAGPATPKREQNAD